MRFGFADTQDKVMPPVQGKGATFNGITAGHHVVVDSSRDAFEFIDSTIGRTWDAWSLWYVMPANGNSEYYKLMGAAPNKLKKQDGHPAQCLCGRTVDGKMFDADVVL